MAENDSIVEYPVITDDTGRRIARVAATVFRESE